LHFRASRRCKTICHFCKVLTQSLSQFLHISMQRHFISAESHSLTSFWTSASSSSSGGGLLCGVERTFVWCSTGTVVDETIINDSPQLASNNSDTNGNESRANCVTFGLNDGRARLSLASCSEAKPFMCQVKTRKLQKSLSDHSFSLQPKCETATCPKNCIKNVCINARKEILTSYPYFGFKTILYV
jgi:hypothetical protein